MSKITTTAPLTHRLHTHTARGPDDSAPHATHRQRPERLCVPLARSTAHRFNARVCTSAVECGTSPVRRATVGPMGERSTATPAPSPQERLSARAGTVHGNDAYEHGCSSR